MDNSNNKIGIYLKYLLAESRQLCCRIEMDGRSGRHFNFFKASSRYSRRGRKKVSLYLGGG